MVSVMGIKLNFLNLIKIIIKNINLNWMKQDN